MPRRNSKFMTEPTIAKMTRAPKGRQIERFDSGADGLALRITDRGTKTWNICYHFPNAEGRRRHHRLTLGYWPTLGVAEAREKARKVKSDVKSGIDPRARRADEQTAARIQAQTEVGKAFEVIAEKFIKVECPNQKRGNETESMIRRLLLPAWAGRQVHEIKKQDARSLTDKLIDEGKPAAAYRLHETMVRLFRWMLKEYDTEFLGFEVSPLANLSPPAKKKKRQRKLDHHELECLWAAFAEQGYPFGTVQKLLLLTGTRRSEVAEAPWTEFDLLKRLWLIPGARTKNGFDHLVPLSGMAMEILETLPRFTEGPFLFSTTGGARPVSGFSKAKVKADEIIRNHAEKNGIDPVTDWVIHDLRRAIRSGLSKLGIAPEVAERVLNHLSGELERTYNLYEYQPEKTDALECWAQEVLNIVEPSPDNVVKLKEHG